MELSQLCDVEVFLFVRDPATQKCVAYRSSHSEDIVARLEAELCSALVYTDVDVSLGLDL